MHISAYAYTHVYTRAYAISLPTSVYPFARLGFYFVVNTPGILVRGVNTKIQLSQNELLQTARHSLLHGGPVLAAS